MLRMTNNKMGIPCTLKLMLGLVLAWHILSPTPLKADALEDAEQALNSGRAEQAIILLEKHATQLVTNERPVAWHLPFDGPMIEKVKLGKRYGYLIGRVIKRSEGTPPHRGITDRSIAESSNLKGQPLWQGTCIDLNTGEVLWTYALPYQARSAIHPEDDSLWIWTRHQTSPIHRVTPAGEIESHGVIQQHRHTSQNANGLRIGTIQIWDTESHKGLMPTRREYDLDRDVLNEVVASSLLSPNGLNKLASSLHQAPSDVTTTIQLVPASVRGSMEAAWELPMRGYASEAPFWVGPDVVALSGGDRSHGFVYRVSGATGAVRWVTALPEPIYSGKYAQRRSGTSGDKGWNTDGLVAGLLPVMGDYGGLFLMDWETGVIVHRYEVGQPLITPLRETEDGTIVVAGYRGVWGLHPDRLTNFLPATSAFVRNARLRVRAYQSLDRPHDALAFCRRLTEMAPSEPELWRLRSEVLLAAGRDVEADSAESTMMKLTSQRVSDRMGASIGLIDRLPTAAITAPIVSTGRIVLIGGQDGTVISYDTGSQSILETTRHEAGILDFWWEDSQLMAELTDRHTIAVRRFGTAPDLEPDDPLLRSEGPKNTPRLWNTSNYLNSWIVKHGEVYVREGRNGGVKVYDPASDEVKEYPPLMGGISRFTVTETPGGWFAFGGQSRGVYEVDPETLRPSRLLIDSGYRIKDNPRSTPNAARVIAGGPDSLAAVFRGFPNERIQVWTYDGKTCLRDVETRMTRTYKYAPERLRRLENGYLYCGSEIVFVPDDPDQPVTRFDPVRLQIRMLHQNRQAEWGFLPPRYLQNGKIVVAHNHGGLYLFDLERFSSGNTQ